MGQGVKGVGNTAAELINAPAVGRGALVLNATLNASSWIWEKVNHMAHVSMLLSATVPGVAAVITGWAVQDL